MTPCTSNATPSTLDTGNPWHSNNEYLVTVTILDADLFNHWISELLELGKIIQDHDTIRPADEAERRAVCRFGGNSYCAGLLGR